MKMPRYLNLAVVSICFLALLATAASAAGPSTMAGQPHIQPGIQPGAPALTYVHGPAPGPNPGQGQGNIPGNNSGQIITNSTHPERVNPGQGQHQDSPRTGPSPINNPGPAHGNVTRPVPGQNPGSVPHDWGNSSMNNPGQGRPITPELFNQLEGKGYDVAELKAALESQNETASRQWLDTFRENNPGVLDKLESAKPWLHEGNVSGNNPGQGRPITLELFNQLAGKGYDVTELQAALESQNETAAKIWLDAFRTNNPGVLDQLENINQGQGQAGGADPGQGQKQHILSPEFVQKLDKKGIDADEFKTAFHSWLLSFLGSNGGVTGSSTSDTSSSTTDTTSSTSDTISSTTETTSGTSDTSSGTSDTTASTTETTSSTS